VDESDVFFTSFCFGFYKRFWRGGKIRHPNYFLSHIFLDEQFGRNAMGKTCTSLTEMENKLFGYLRGRDHLIRLGVEVQFEGMEKYRRRFL
jgi:hypothetical protein